MKKVTVELEIQNEETGMDGIFVIDAEVTGDVVDFDWSTGGVWWATAHGAARGPCDYDVSKYQEECLIDLALNAADEIK